MSKHWQIQVQPRKLWPKMKSSCIQLHVLQGIKRHQGSHHLKHQPITSDQMQIICHLLDPSNHNHTMLWVVFCLGFFSFLRAGEFTVYSPFIPDIHLTINNIQEDSSFNPCSFRIYIKCSGTDPFCQGCYIQVEARSPDLCPVHALVQYPHLCGSTPGLLCLLSDGTH